MPEFAPCPLWLNPLHPACHTYAEALAARHGFALTTRLPESGVYLSLMTPDHHNIPEAIPKLVLGKAGAKGIVEVDFGAGGARHRRLFGGGELIAKAVDAKRFHTVIDATAGLGRDAFVLAALGMQVQLFEHHPVAFALLDNGLTRAQQDPELAPIVARMCLHSGSLNAYRQQHPQLSADVVYLDPMYPQRHKSGAVKKEMAYFHEAVGAADAADDAELLETARHVAAHRVVVKRPRLGEVLAGQTPAFAYTGKSTRFDAYLPLA